MISEDLFELPDTWAWVPLRQLCIFLSRGKSPKYSETAKYPVFAQKCNQPAGLALERALFLDETTLDKWQEFFRLQDGDILINSTGTGTMGRVGYYESVKLNPEYPFMVPDSHVTVARVGDGLVSKYAYYALRSPSLQKIMEKQFRGTTNQKEFYINSAAAMPIPLPPPTVQERIVEVLDSSLEFLQIIDQLQTQYADNLTVLKSKLIDAAIQGKLTEQLPEDGTAEELYQQIQEEKQALIRAGKIKKEKPLPEITEDEVPFEIPANWKWVRLGSIGVTVTGGTPAKSKPEYYGGNYPFFKPSDLDAGPHIIQASEYLTEAGKLVSRQLPKGSILVCCIGSIGKAAIIDTDGTSNQQINAMVPILSASDYLLYAIESIAFQRQLNQGSRATTVSIINKSKFDNCILPLPPLGEQKRIIAKLNMILPLCERLL